VAGVVLSQCQEEDPEAARSNLHQIQRRWQGRALLLRSDASVLEGLLPRWTSASS
jgi:hypothetical protein